MDEPSRPTLVTTSYVGRLGRGDAAPGIRGSTSTFLTILQKRGWQGRPGPCHRERRRNAGLL
jgi:hypothetical protein